MCEGKNFPVRQIMRQDDIQGHLFMCKSVYQSRVRLLAYGSISVGNCSSSYVSVCPALSSLMAVEELGLFEVKALLISVTHFEYNFVLQNPNVYVALCLLCHPIDVMYKALLFDLILEREKTA